MKNFLKSKKGITTVVALVIVIIVLIFLLVKCGENPDSLNKGKDVIKTEQGENKDNEDNQPKLDLGNREVEDTSNAGLTSAGGVVGEKNTDESTEFPNDVDSETGDSANSGDSGTETGSNEDDNTETDTNEGGDSGKETPFKGGTVY